jgi:hypothetical protein
MFGLLLHEWTGLQKVPALRELAPTHKEPPFVAAQILALLIFATSSSNQAARTRSSLLCSNSRRFPLRRLFFGQRQPHLEAGIARF